MIYSVSASSSVRVIVPLSFLTILTPSLTGSITLRTFITSFLFIPVRSYSPSSPLYCSSSSQISSSPVVLSLPLVPSSVSSGFSSEFSGSTSSTSSSSSGSTSSTSNSSSDSEIIWRNCLFKLSSTTFFNVSLVVSSSCLVNLSLSSTRFLIYSLLILLSFFIRNKILFYYYFNYKYAVSYKNTKKCYILSFLILFFDILHIFLEKNTKHIFVYPVYLKYICIWNTYSLIHS